MTEELVNNKGFIGLELQKILNNIFKVQTKCVYVKSKKSIREQKAFLVNLINHQPIRLIWDFCIWIRP